MVTPGMMVAAAPIDTFVSTTIGATVMERRRMCGLAGWPAVTRLTVWAISYRVSP
jgi:hypothetical protein